MILEHDLKESESRSPFGGKQVLDVVPALILDLKRLTNANDTVTQRARAWDQLWDYADQDNGIYLKKMYEAKHLFVLIDRDLVNPDVALSTTVWGFLRSLTNIKPNQVRMLKDHGNIVHDAERFVLRAKEGKVQRNEEEILMHVWAFARNLAFASENQSGLMSQYPRFMDAAESVIVEHRYENEKICKNAWLFVYNMSTHLENQPKFLMEYPNILRQCESILVNNHARRTSLQMPNVTSWQVTDIGEEGAAKAAVAITTNDKTTAAAWGYCSNLSQSPANYVELFKRHHRLVDESLVVVERFDPATSSIKIWEFAWSLILNLSIAPENKLGLATNRMIHAALRGIRHGNLESKNYAFKFFMEISADPAVAELLREERTVISELVAESRNEHDFYGLLALANIMDDMLLKANHVEPEIFLLIADVLPNALTGSFRLRDPLVALRALVNADYDRRILVIKRPELLLNLVNVANKAFEQNDALSLDLALECLTQFAFDEEPKAWMKSNNEVAKMIERVGKATNTAMRPANKTLAILNFKLLGEDEKLAAMPVASSKTICISYSPVLLSSGDHSVQSVAKAFEALLIAQHFEVFTVENLNVDAVASSGMMIALINTSYKTSVTCKASLTFAKRTGKRVVPVLVHTGPSPYDYLHDGWLGHALTGLPHYDASQPNRVGPEMQTLMVRELSSGGNPARTSLSMRRKSSATLSRENFPKTEKEIRAWAVRCEMGDQVADALFVGGFKTSNALISLSKNSAHDIHQVLQINQHQAYQLKEALEKLVRTDDEDDRVEAQFAPPPPPDEE